MVSSTPANSLFFIQYFKISTLTSLNSPIFILIFPLNSLSISSALSRLSRFSHFLLVLSISLNFLNYSSIPQLPSYLFSFLFLSSLIYLSILHFKFLSGLLYFSRHASQIIKSKAYLIVFSSQNDLCIHWQVETTTYTNDTAIFYHRHCPSFTCGQ